MLEDLRKMLEQKASKNIDQDLERFGEMLETAKTLKQCQLDILLRKAVQYKVAKFSSYHNLLINKGADVNFYDLRENKTNLMIACENGNKEIVETLASNSNVNFQLQDKKKHNALFYALYTVVNKMERNTSKQFLINSQSWQVTSKLQVDSEANMEKTLLFTAVEKQRYQIVRILLSRNADPNKPVSDTGNTPLHEAVKILKSKDTQNIRKIIRVLVESHANHTLKNKQDKDVLEFSQGYQEYIKQIIEKHKQISAQIQNQKEKKDEDPSQSSEQSESYYQSFSDTNTILTEDFSREIQAYSEICDKEYKLVLADFQIFLIEFNKMIGPMGLRSQIYGSFATGLWLKHCDIDLLIIPTNENHSKPNQQLLDEIYAMLFKSGKFKSVSINNKIKFPTIRVQVYDLGGQTRRIVVTIIDKNHNGQKSVNYIEQSLTLYPNIKPIFFVLKTLIIDYHLNDPKTGGIRTYALLIMLLSYVQKYQESNLAQLLVGFLHFFGFVCQYGQVLVNENHSCLVLNIADPLNVNNNVGKHTNVAAMQNMFKVVYISLHSKIHGEKLGLIFETKKIFV